MMLFKIIFLFLLNNFQSTLSLSLKVPSTKSEECLLEQQIEAFKSEWIYLPLVGRVYLDEVINFGKYVTLDRNFSFVEEFHRNNISETANDYADELAEEILDEPTNSNYQYDWYVSPTSQESWVYIITDLSHVFRDALDETNIFFNRGNTSLLNYNRNRFSYYLETLSSAGKAIDRFVYEELPHYMHIARIKPFPKQKILKEASCLYKKLEMQANDNSLSLYTSLVTAFVEKVPEVRFLAYIENVLDALESAVQSNNAEKFVKTLYERIQKKIKNDFDINAITAATYSSYVELRSKLLKMDIEAVIKNINDIVNTVDEAMFKTERGQWPEMNRFLDNLLRLTFGKTDFWMKLDKLYQKALSKWENEKEMTINGMEYQVLPFFRYILKDVQAIGAWNGSTLDLDVLNLRALSGGISWIITQFGSGFKWLSYNACSVTWAWFENEDYSAVKNEINNNDFYQYLSDMLFSNWPEKEIFPTSMDIFFEKLFKMTMSVSKAIRGLCI